MTAWPPHLYITQRPAECSLVNAKKWLAEAKQLQDKGYPAVLSLRHLSLMTRVRYATLRAIVARHFFPYSIVRIKKKQSSEPRELYCPNYSVKRVQRWIVQNILRQAQPHPASYAYRAGVSNPILNCAQVHCGSMWLVKIDIKDFFENISERQVYRIFRDIGYRPLVSFELTRICSTTYDGIPLSYAIDMSDQSLRFRRLQDALAEDIDRKKAIERYFLPNIRVNHKSLSSYKHKYISNKNRWHASRHYRTCYQPICYRLADQHGQPMGSIQLIGHLPQGAPTSPMLANLSMESFDASVSEKAGAFGFVYTRYSDDLTFSSCLPNVNRSTVRKLIDCVYGELFRRGLSPAMHKTKVAGPGSRKIVLGLLVDGPRPRLSRQFRNSLDAKIYHIARHGFDEQAKCILREKLQNSAKNPLSRDLNFIAIVRHINGLIEFARSIDPALVDKMGWDTSFKALREKYTV